MFACRVIALDVHGQLQEIARVPERPSGLGWLPDGRLVIVSMHDHRLLVLNGKTLEVYADLRGYCEGPLNDMAIDSRGRAYIGNFGFDYPLITEPKPTGLIMVGVGRPQIVAEDLLFPNGIAISPDGRTLIVAESYANRLTAFDINIETGALSGRRTFAELGGCSPDGICLDAQGAVWVASYNTCEFLRVCEDGDITHRIPADNRCAVACVTGGLDRKSLYMLTAETNDEDFARGKSLCRVTVASVDVPGAGIP